MEVSGAKKLRVLEAENAKLKKLLAESMIDVSTRREMLGKTSEAQFEEGRREPPPAGECMHSPRGAMTEKRYSQKRACRLVGTAPRVFRYRSARRDDNAVRARLRELATERRRFGCRRPHILLAREGVEMNWKKLYPLADRRMEH